MQKLKRGDRKGDIETLKSLTWFSNGDHTFGVCPNTPPRVVADVLSASFPVPLGTDAVMSEDRLSVGNLHFNRVEEPKNPNRHDQIYIGAGRLSGIA